VAARNAKATAQFRAGRVGDAKHTWDEALALAKDAMAPAHPNYMSILSSSANADLALGDVQGARAKLETALAALKQRPGPDHPRTLEAARLLATAYDRLDLPERAAALRAEFPAAAAAAQ
jgi:tetratricopeptide (TPR) repeat protein